MDVKDVMTRGAITIREDAMVSDAIKKMMDRRVTSLVVEISGKKDCYGHGIITRKDIVNKLIAYGKNPFKTKVSEVMSKPVLTVTPDMDVTNVARLMAKIDTRRFLVVENRRVVGMVSNSDILRAVTLECL